MNAEMNTLIAYAKVGDESAQRILKDMGYDIDWEYAIIGAHGKPLHINKIIEIHDTLVSVTKEHGMTMAEARDGLEKAIRESPQVPVIKFDDHDVTYATVGTGLKRGTNRTLPKKRRKKR